MIDPLFRNRPISTPREWAEQATDADSYYEAMACALIAIALKLTETERSPKAKRL